MCDAEWVVVVTCEELTAKIRVRAIMPRNADLKYAGSVRESESHYSIIVGLPHLHPHPGLALSQ